MNISPIACIHRKAHLTSCEIDDELVLFDLEEGNYYGLNSIGASIWALLSDPLPFEKLCLELMNKYEVSQKQCAEDVLKFLTELKDKNLIEIRS